MLSHEDAVSVLLREALKANPEGADLVSAITATVLVPYAMGADTDIVVDVLEALEVRGRTAVIAGARLLVENVERFAIRRARAGWFEALRGALNKAGIERWVVTIPSLEAPSRSDSSSADVLERKDGSKLTVEEVLARISTAEDLLGILAEQRTDENQAGSSSFFDWRKVIRKVMPKLNASKTRQLAEALPGSYRDAFCLVDLARHARSIGESRLARELAVRAVEKSSHSGWDRYYDGGSRLEALECLLEINPTGGREEAWRRFREDFHDENYARTRFVFNLQRVATILVEAVPMRDLYAEIEQHVQALFEGVELGTSGPDLRLEETGPHNGASEALCSLLEFHLTHHVLWVMEATWRCLGHILRTQPSGGRGLVESLMAASERVQERLVPVIEAIGRSDAALIAPYRDKIVALAASPHGGLRCAARRVARTFGWTLPERVSPAVSTLPSIYNLALPPIDEAMREEMFADVRAEWLVSRGSDEPPLAAHLAELEEMARVTGVPAANLIRRAGQIMLELDPSRGWTDEAEKRLQAWLEGMGPKFTYRRPSYLAGRRAVHQLLAELEDYGVADLDQVAHLCGILRWYDPSLVLHVPAARPDAVLAWIPTEGEPPNKLPSQHKYV